MITIDFLIPVYNEEQRLGLTFHALSRFVAPRGIKLNKIIFVNDGSHDNTLKILKSTKIKYKKEVISYAKNRGKGYAIKQGLLKSSADYVLFFDADMSTPLTELKKFLPFFQDEYGLVIGTRKNGQSTVISHQPILRESLGKIFTLLSQLILNTWVTDFTCGFKALRHDVAQAIGSRIQINRWGFDSEIIFIARVFGFSMHEQAVVWSNEPNTKVNLLRDAIRSFKELLTIRYNQITGKYSLEKDCKLATIKL